VNRKELIHRWSELAPRKDVLLLDGFHAVKHALRFKADIPLVLTTNRQNTLALSEMIAPDINSILSERLIEVADDDYRRLVGRPHPTGVTALARRPPPVASEDLSATDRVSPLVLLEDPRNLGNVGAVVRLAAGMGASAVVTTGTVDPWHPQVVRASAGLHYAIPVLQTSLDRFVDGPLYALDPEGSDLRRVTLPDNAVLAFGTERHGVSAAVRQRADHLIAIPMQPLVSSYNLATSVAMALYHWRLISHR
jgi:tRNA G18 (ribose-2'-O)-methylase SpoU